MTVNALDDEQWTNLLVSLRSGSPAATAKDVLYVIKDQLASARAQGAAEERERLAKLAEEIRITEILRCDSVSATEAALATYRKLLKALRSNTGEG